MRVSEEERASNVLVTWDGSSWRCALARWPVLPGEPWGECGGGCASQAFRVGSGWRACSYPHLSLCTPNPISIPPPGAESDQCLPGNMAAAEDSLTL